jgi:tetratricopeptide (TPR) repeat protein
MVSAGLYAQTAPATCPADRPVDDIIAEIQKQQSKRKHRNTNPLPENICIFGWCSDHSRTPKTVPEPAPETPGDEKTSNDENKSSSGTSSSRIPMEACRNAMQRTLAAAHNIEVGDYYFKDKNFSAALLRYNDALDEKPADPAIHVRLGRVLEKLNQLPRAIEHYQAAQKLDGPEKWSDEAKSALSRLQPPPGS